MKHEIINLLDNPTEHGFMPTLKTYLLDMIENKDCLRPAVIVFPGGGYGHCSYREGERIALGSAEKVAVKKFYRTGTFFHAGTPIKTTASPPQPMRIMINFPIR